MPMRAIIASQTAVKLFSRRIPEKTPPKSIPEALEPSVREPITQVEGGLWPWQAQAVGTTVVLPFARRVLYTSPPS